MSYQMGALLGNCIASIDACMPGASIGIYDDGSDDPLTLDILSRATRRHYVYMGSRAPARTDHKVGGLYGNMNRAVADAIAGGYSYILFFQDDMQVVRDVTTDTLTELSRIFSSASSIVQIRVHFMKHPFANSNHVPSIWSPSNQAPHYVHRDSVHGILDTGLTRLDLLQSSSFTFEGDELLTAARAAALKWESVFPVNPIAMFLPWPPTIHSGRPLHWRMLSFHQPIS